MKARATTMRTALKAGKRGLLLTLSKETPKELQSSTVLTTSNQDRMGMRGT
jgi:hypothetical protein